MTDLTDAALVTHVSVGDHPQDALAELLRRARREALREAAALLLAMAEDADRFAASSMARLDDLAKGHAFREAARRVGEMHS